MARNIEIPETGKFVKVEKLGKKTYLQLGDTNQRKASAESRAFMVLTPIAIPLVMTLAAFPTMAELTLTANNATHSNFLAFVASTPGYVTIPLMVLAIIATVISSFKLTKMFAKTETSDFALSSENAQIIAKEKSNKRIAVDGNISKNSSISIIQSFISQAYPEMIVANESAKKNSIEYDYVMDKTFSKIFNQNAA